VLEVRGQGEDIKSVLEEFEDTKEVIRICKTKKNRQYNGQKKKDKGTNNDQQNITHTTRVRVTWTTLKTGDELRYSRKISNFCSTSSTCRINLVTNTVISHECGIGNERTFKDSKKRNQRHLPSPLVLIGVRVGQSTEFTPSSYWSSCRPVYWVHHHVLVEFVYANLLSSPPVLSGVRVGQSTEFNPVLSGVHVGHSTEFTLMS